MTQFEVRGGEAAPVEEPQPANRARGRPKGASKAAGGNGKANGAGDLGFETKLWATADVLRGSMDASLYKNVVLGLIFLKYVSDTFEEHRQQLERDTADPENQFYLEDEDARNELLEDRDLYTMANVFWVPQPARWSYLQANAKQPNIGKLVDDAMLAIEAENDRLKGVLPKDYAQPGLDQRRLGELIDLIGTIGLGDKENRAKDILGRVYEYFLGRFAAAEGKMAGEFYTPRHVVRLLVAMLEPKVGMRIYDPCCGSGGMFVQSEKFVEDHGGRLGDVSIFGQESNHMTWRMCQMNLAIRGIEGVIKQGDTFHNDQLRDEKFDIVLANPPFNNSNWGGELLQDDVRWKYGKPPAGNANFAWVQHFVHHLKPTGTAGFVLANGSMSSNSSGEGDIRRALIEQDLVDCMVALPGQLFYSTPIPVCLWFLTRNKKGGGFRDRSGETLFIDARKLGMMVDRTHRELTDEDVGKVANTYHAWRGEPEAGEYEDVAGFCRSATVDEIAGHGFVLTPGRFVGAEDLDDDGEPFDEKMARLKNKLEKQFAAGREYERAIQTALARLT